jgi:MoxR-like ATPase
MGALRVKNILMQNVSPIIGRDDIKRWLLTALLADGYLLLEDYPGSGMAQMVQIIGQSIDGSDVPDGALLQPFRRVHCTNQPGLADLMALGAFRTSDSAAPVEHGRIISTGLFLENFGRAAEQVQAMLIDAASDGIITLDGHSRNLEILFFVASQAQHDRPLSPFLLNHFMFKAHVGTLAPQTEARLLQQTSAPWQLETVSRQELQEARQEIRQGIRLADDIFEKVTELMTLLEHDDRIQQNGRPSTRALLDLKHAAQAYAFLHGCEQADWQAHVRPLIPLALAHRLRCKPAALESPEKILRKWVRTIEAKPFSAGRAPLTPDAEVDNWTLQDAWRIYRQLESNIKKRIFGRDSDDESGRTVSTLELMLLALFSGGHVLLEDYPGSGKSYMSKTLGESIEDDVREEAVVEIRAYQRVQCTPDLLPSDITGYMMLQGGNMIFRRGPIFAYVLLADEINRTPPKVQSAMLEAMAEKQVTVDERTYRLGDLFFVIATQNPLDRKGTFELPHAQLDRFLFKRLLAPLDQQSVMNILTIDESRRSAALLEKVTVTAILKSRQAILREGAVNTYNHSAHQDIKDILLSIRAAFDRRYDERQLRDSERWQVLKPSGQPSARALEAFLKALKVRAFVRFFREQEARQAGPHAAPVIEAEDIRRLGRDVLRHRIVPKYETDPHNIPDPDVQEYTLLEDKIIMKAVSEGIELYTRKTSP